MSAQQNPVKMRERVGMESMATHVLVKTDSLVSTAKLVSYTKILKVRKGNQIKFKSFLSKTKRSCSFECPFKSFQNYGACTS